MSFLSEYATARQTQQGIGEDERAMARTRLADTAATNARMEALKKADADRRYAAQGLPPEYSMSGTMEPGQAAPAPGAQVAAATQGRGRVTAPRSLPGIYDNPPLLADQTEAETQRLARMRSTGTFNRMPGATPVPLPNTPAVITQRADELRRLNPADAGVGVTTMQGGSNTDAAKIAQLKAADAAIRGQNAPAGASVAERNNNPGNLKFAGQAGARPGPLLSDGTRFAVFDTPEAGMAANVNQLRIYGTKGINTVEKIINTWSPGDAPGNTPQSTANYITHVARTLGVAPNQPLDMSNPQVLQAILQAQAPFESGAGSAPQRGQTAAAAPAPAQPAAPQGTPGAMYGGQPDPQALQRQLADATRQYQYLQERMGIESDDGRRQQLLGQMDAVKGAYVAAQTSFAYQTGNLPALVNIANSMGIPVGLRDAGNGQVIAVAQGQSSPPMDRAAAAQWLYGQVDAQQRAADAKRQEAYRAAEQKYQFDALLEREKGSQARQTEVLKGIREFEAKALEAGVKANEIKFERLENGDVVAVVRGQMYMVPTRATAGGGASKFGGAVAAPLQPVSFGQ